MLAGNDALRAELTALVRQALHDPAALEATLDADSSAAADAGSDAEGEAEEA